MGPASTLILGTDGIWEARNGQKEMFGKNRLCQFLNDHSHCSASKIARNLDEQLLQFIGDAQMRDDITYIVIRLTGVAADVHPNASQALPAQLR